MYGPSLNLLMCFPSFFIERARSLCEMIKRRELKKKEMIRVLRAEFTLSAQSFGAALGIDGMHLCGHGSSWARETETSLDAEGRLRWQVGVGNKIHHQSYNGFNARMLS